MNFSERIAHLATNPYVAPVLDNRDCWDNYGNLAPGFGIPGIAGLMAFGLFFVAIFLQVLLNLGL